MTHFQKRGKMIKWKVEKTKILKNKRDKTLVVLTADY